MSILAIFPFLITPYVVQLYPSRLWYKPIVSLNLLHGPYIFAWCFFYIFAPVYLGDKSPSNDIKSWEVDGKEIKAIKKFKKAFFIKLIDETNNEDIDPNYSGKELAYWVADAYIHVRIRNGETTSLSNFSCYRNYLASGGKRN